MKKFLILAACAAPLVLAACEEVGVQSEQTVIGASATEQPVVVPGSERTDGTTVVVQPTKLVSTNLAALAGSYDVDALKCNDPASPSRVTVSDSGMVLEGQQCQLADLDREGSALKVGLSCVSGNTRTERVAYVTPAAQGILLRASTAGDQALQRCGK